MICTKKLNKIANAQTVEELWDMHTACMADYGFDRLIYGFTRYRTAHSLGNPDDFLLMSSHDTSYTDVFIGQGYYRHAPMMRWVLEQDGATSWSVLKNSIDKHTLSPDEMRVVELNREHGVIAGYSVSFKSLSPRSKGAIALTAKPGLSQKDVDKIWEEHGEDITFINNLMHLRFISLPYQCRGQTLTSRQREVLGWVGDGKTIQDIATLMNLTPATIEKHLRLARESLNVETTAQAVLKAAFLNQIFSESDFQL